MERLLVDWLDTLGDSIKSLAEQDLKILSLLDHATDRIIAQDAEIAELREGVVALSNRIEAVTRLHSVKA
jgi:hypothetical protein